jgi:hypothetical protein
VLTADVDGQPARCKLPALPPLMLVVVHPRGCRLSGLADRRSRAASWQRIGSGFAPLLTATARAGPTLEPMGVPAPSYSNTLRRASLV